MIRTFQLNDQLTKFWNLLNLTMDRKTLNLYYEDQQN